MIYVDQKVLDSLREGTFDESMLEATGMEIVDADINDGLVAEDSLAESCTNAGIDSVLFQE